VFKVKDSDKDTVETELDIEALDVIKRLYGNTFKSLAKREAIEKIIEAYGSYVLDLDLDVSPFEFLQMLHLRSKLQSVFTELIASEQATLLELDKKLLNNAEAMSKHIGSIYKWDVSTEPYSHWWWHLDRVANGTLVVEL